MPPIDDFNWRAFWGDLLRGSGRALLTLDGSEEAQAAMTGLDSFDAAQSRRAEQTRISAEDDSNDLSSDVQAELAQRRAAGVRVAPARRRADMPGIEGYPGVAAFLSDRDALAMPHPHWASSWSQGMPMPRPRSMPMSANPYDFGGLPAQVSFPSEGLPVIHRR